MTWLCSQSGVARSTFYTHFATVDDLAAFTLTEVLASLAADDVAQRTVHLRERRAISKAGLTRVVESFEQARDLLGYAMGVGSRASVVEGLVAQFAGYNRDTVATEYGHLDDARLDLIAEFVSAGTVHTLLRWMDDPGGVGREELVDVLVDLLPAPLTR